MNVRAHLGDKHAPARYGADTTRADYSNFVPTKPIFHSEDIPHSPFNIASLYFVAWFVCALIALFASTFYFILWCLGVA